jgi:sodium/hydrogen antiporter
VTEGVVIAVAIAVVGWAFASAWLADRNLSGPLVLVVAGLVVGNPDWGVVSIDVDSASVHLLAEITLALLLFGDASAVPLAAARSDLPITARLLGIGLPVTIVLGGLLAMLLFDDMTLALAGLLAASLAPTDAALSATVISDERLPERIRRVLNVESGLNDGIATPIVTVCIAAAATAMGLIGHDDDGGVGAIGQLVVGGATGAGIGLVGGRLLVYAERHRWMQHGARRLIALGLALLAFLSASELGGNPFVAAFAGGLAFGAAAREDASVAVEFTELTGTLLSLVLWFVFGAAFVLPAFEDLDLAMVGYAVASLTLIRMLPVALALAGSGQPWPTVWFIGWFGPRGLASVVFALLAVEELGLTRPARRPRRSDHHRHDRAQRARARRDRPTVDRSLPPVSAGDDVTRRQRLAASSSHPLRRAVRR